MKLETSLEKDGYRFDIILQPKNLETNSQMDELPEYQLADLRSSMQTVARFAIDFINKNIDA